MIIADLFLPSNSLKTLESFSESSTAPHKERQYVESQALFLVESLSGFFWSFSKAHFEIKSAATNTSAVLYSFFTCALMNIVSKTRYLDKYLQIYAKSPPILIVEHKQPDPV